MLNQRLDELSHRHRHKVSRAIMVSVPECDRFSIVSVQSCVCNSGVSNISGHILCYPFFVRDSGFFW